MRTMFWLLALVLVGLLGYLLHAFIEGRKAQSGFYNFEASNAEVAQYSDRADSLSRVADSLRARLDQAGLLARGSVREHLTLVEDELAALRKTIELWGKSRATRRDVDLYRKVILLYGEASAAARALAGDTLIEGER